MTNPGHEGPGDTPEDGSMDGTPRWVKTFFAIVLAVVVLFVILQFVGGGEHGPGRHGDATDTPPTGMTDGGGHTPPPGADHGGDQL